MEVYSWENPRTKWVIYTMAMLVITRGYPAEKTHLSHHKNGCWLRR